MKEKIYMTKKTTCKLLRDFYYPSIQSHSLTNRKQDASIQTTIKCQCKQILMPVKLHPVNAKQHELSYQGMMLNAVIINNRTAFIQRSIEYLSTQHLKCDLCILHTVLPVVHIHRALIKRPNTCTM